MKFSDVIISLTFASSLITTVSAQTGNETLHGLSSISPTYSSIGEGSDVSQALSDDPVVTHVDIPGSIVIRLEAPVDPSQYGGMKPGTHDRRFMHKQRTFVPFTDQKEAEKRVESAVGYFHNLHEYDPNGVRKCFLIPTCPIAKPFLVEERFEIVCEVTAPSERSRSGPFTYVKALGTEARTKEALYKHFMGAGSLWEFAPIKGFLG